MSKDEKDLGRIAKLEEQRRHILKRIEEDKSLLLRIPYATTFDLEGWEQFSAEMKARCEQMASSQIEKRHALSS